jgi:hypothetical protein
MPPRKWPSLQSQLKQSNAPSGSRLAMVIRENQDFDLLDATEFNDDYDLPPWLRVFWRKSHPDFQPEAGPVGEAYPDILYNIHERMVADPNLPWGSSEESAGPKEEEAPRKSRPKGRD